MPKKIFFESFVHQFLTAARLMADKERQGAPENYTRWVEFISSLRFKYAGPGLAEVSWKLQQSGRDLLDFKGTRLYERGDRKKQGGGERQSEITQADDLPKEMNRKFFDSAVTRIARAAGITIQQETIDGTEHSNLKKNDLKDDVTDRLREEEQFHDEWATSENISSINVRLSNESCTAPEMRYIRSLVGDLKGKTLLDVGCGLGEASVYFAMEGADVTATDLSQEMLNATLKLAAQNNVQVRTHHSAAEDLRLAEGVKFDIIYAGNLLHHVDIRMTLMNIVKHLKPEGRMVSWDPVAYNPIINVYRRIAEDVRTKDEHPFKMEDIRMFRNYFERVEVKWFWLTTLSIFIIMALIQRRNPNKVRYWKKIVEEGEKWAWLYIPLEKFDAMLLKIFPFLGPLCWNVVISATRPKRTT